MSSIANSQMGNAAKALIDVGTIVLSLSTNIVYAQETDPFLFVKDSPNYQLLMKVAQDVIGHGEKDSYKSHPTDKSADEENRIEIRTFKEILRTPEDSLSVRVNDIDSNGKLSVGDKIVVDTPMPYSIYSITPSSIDAVTYTIKSNGVKASLTDADLLVLSIFGNDDKISKDEIYRRVNNVSLRNRINQLDRLRHIYVRK